MEHNEDQNIVQSLITNCPSEPKQNKLKKGGERKESREKMKLQAERERELKCYFSLLGFLKRIEYNLSLTQLKIKLRILDRERERAMR